MTNPLRDRFGIPIRLNFYSTSELELIVNRGARVLDVAITPDGAKQTGGVVWPGVPRATAPRLISNVRPMANPYEALGVAPNASQDDIRKAYRKAAKETHPDLNPGKPEAENRFKEINAAYDIIGDADKRKKFDAGEIDADGRETMRGFAGGGPFGQRLVFAGGDRLDHLRGELGIRDQPRFDAIVLLRFVEALDPVIDHVGFGIVGMPKRDHLLRDRLAGHQARHGGECY